MGLFLQQEPVSEAINAALPALLPLGLVGALPCTERSALQLPQLAFRPSFRQSRAALAHLRRVQFDICSNMKCPSVCHSAALLKLEQGLRVTNHVH